uniref:Ribonuclease A-domain domain-containing protein n=2 Tax=Salarias fasciatus TaxID=181472 RepID=A0A672F454_SALFA
METSDCDKVMKRKIFVRKNKRCKPVNTFILADESEVISVCENGTPEGEGGEYVKSKAVFNLIACKLTNKETKYPNCKYEGKELSEKKIVIKCINNYPVHYEGDLRYCEA